MLTIIKKILCNISTLPILSVAKIKWRLLTLMMDANYSVTVWGSKRFNVNRSCVSSQLTSLTMTNFWVTIIITPFLYLSLTIRHVNWYQILFANFFFFFFCFSELSHNKGSLVTTESPTIKWGSPRGNTKCDGTHWQCYEAHAIAIAMHRFIHSFTDAQNVFFFFLTQKVSLRVKLGNLIGPTWSSDPHQPICISSSSSGGLDTHVW